MKDEIIQRGAEAILILRNGNLLKYRIKKPYRLKILDEKLRKSRTKKEAKLIEKSSKIISVPKIKKISDFEIYMELINGKKLSENFEKLKNWKIVCQIIGRNIARLHEANIIHGDLTTSNMIFNEEEKKVYFVDFGLGFESERVEDKAVDLHLLKQALEAKHYANYKAYFREILKGYKLYKGHIAVLKRLEKVENRGRYKNQY